MNKTSTWINRLILLTGVTSILFTGLAMGQKPWQEKPNQERKVYGKNHPFKLEELPEGNLKTKLKTLDPQAREKAMKWLHTFNFAGIDAVESLGADKEGGIYYACSFSCAGCKSGEHDKSTHDDTPSDTSGAPEADSTETAEPTSNSKDALEPNTENGLPLEDNTASWTPSGTVVIANPPVFSSKPGAPNVIYLDFNGGIVTGTAWNGTVPSFDTLAWSMDADRTTFTNSEQIEIRQIWERMSEDYALFDVNVTTDKAYDPDIYTGNRSRVGWCLFTPTKDRNGVSNPHDGYGGIAYVGVFGNATYANNSPAWNIDYGQANAAEVGSHEMGHNMGLSHDGLFDGTATTTYYGGHAAVTGVAPSWGPIMGTGYGRNVSQWSKSTEYFNGNQTQDDFTILSGKLTYRPDDHGNTSGTATPWLSGAVNQIGIIGRTTLVNNDIDTFTFNHGGGTISLNAATYRTSAGTWGGNLDILLELYDNSGALVASNNPADLVTASISVSAPVGRYYVMLKASGAGNPLISPPSGYTVYGSMGQYKITGNFVPEDGILLSSPGGGEMWVAGITYPITWGSAMGGNVKIELFKGGLLHSTLAATTPNDGSFNWAIPSGIALANDYRVRITSIEQPTKFDQSSSDFTIRTDPLANALDTTNLAWSTSGTLPWFYQTTITNDGVDAAQSGAIGDSQVSTMETTLVGPGTMTFWWRVSSELNYDFLRFYLNGVEQTGSLARISGTVNWVQKTVSIPTGSNVVRWSYTKDGSVLAGSDAAWVDQVVFTSLAAPLIVVEEPVGTGLTNGATVNFGSVNIGNSAPARTFTIRNNGTEDLTGLALSKSGTHNADYTLSNLTVTTLAPGAWTTFTVTFAPGAAGTRTAALHIASNDTLRNPFNINLTGNGLGPGTLAVAGAAGLTSSGNIGGPFTPSSIVYTLSNPGGTSITWTAAKTQSWVTLSAVSGTLAAGASTTVTVTINTGANSLPANTYNDTVTFTNTTNNSGNTTRAVALTVNTPPVVNAGPDQTIFLTGSVWSPTELNPIAWYDASDAATVTQVGGAVSQWSSKVGTSHMLQATGIKQPIVGGANQINGLNAIAFDGTDDALKTASNPFGASVSNAMVMAVTNIGTTVNSTMFSLTGGSANRWQAHAPWGDGNVYFDCGGASGVNRVSGASGWTAGQNKLLGFYSSTTDNVQQVWANGTMMLGDATGHTVTTTSGLALGHDGATSYDNCRMGEVVILNSTVTATNRQKLEGYLAHKWGLATNLPVGHPYETASPNNAVAIANLNGTASDADGNILVTTWSFVSGPAAVVFGNTSALATTATFTTAGVYTLRLTVNDGFTSVSDEVIITVNPAPAGFTVTYAGNGSTGGTVPVDGTSYNNADTVTVRGNTGSLTRTGYTFAGWNTVANGTGTPYQPGATFSISANVTLYAQWTGLPYTVTFDKQSGSGGSTSVSATMGSAMPVATAPTRTGYTFAGYFTLSGGGGIQYYTATMQSARNWDIAANTTLYAHWTGNPYTVTFNPNGGGTPSPESKVVAYGSTYGTLATVARTGHTFNGWFTAATGGSLVTASTTVTTMADHTLYARWTVSTYTVSYDGNGATSGNAPANQTKTHDVDLTLLNQGTLLRTGYTFAGWNTAADGTGTPYAAGANYSANASTTLFAQWTANTYTVTFNANGGQTPVPTSKQVTYDSSYNALATTTRAGYSFNGWFTAAVGGSQVTAVTTVTVAADHTLYAQWTQLIVGMEVSRNATVIAVGGFDALDGTTAGTGAKLNYDITNAGTDTLTLANAVISGQSNCLVAIDNQPSASVLPSSLTELVLTATPTTAGPWSFTVSIANNHPDKNPYQWTVHGVAASSTIVSLTAVADTYIWNKNITTNYGTQTTFRIFNRTQASSLHYGLLRFNLSSIPTNATITAASLDLIQSNTVTGPVSVYEATGTWTELGATWENSNLLYGADSYGVASAPGTAGGSVSTGLSVAGVNKVQSWLGAAPLGNHGFGVKTTNSGSSQNIDLYTKEHATADNHPKLTLTYTVNPQVAEMHVTRAGLVVADGGTDFVSNTTASTGTQLTYQIVNLGNVNLTMNTPITVSGALNCTVVVNTQPSNTLVPSTATSLVVTVTPTAGGAWSANLSIANNDPDANPYNWTISGTALSLYNRWSGSLSKDEDTNGDGITNGMAWALGADDPEADATGLLPTAESTATHFIFTYRRNDEVLASPDANLYMQYGTNIADWLTAVSGANITITETDDFYESGLDRVEVRINLNQAPTGKIFGRLKLDNVPLP